MEDADPFFFQPHQPHRAEPGRQAERGHDIGLEKIAKDSGLVEVGCYAAGNSFV